MRQYGDTLQFQSCGTYSLRIKFYRYQWNHYQKKKRKKIGDSISMNGNCCNAQKTCCHTLLLSSNSFFTQVTENSNFQEKVTKREDCQVCEQTVTKMSLQIIKVAVFIILNAFMLHQCLTASYLLFYLFSSSICFSEIDQQQKLKKLHKSIGPHFLQCKDRQVYMTLLI